MGLQIYVNYLADGGFHLGVTHGDSTTFVRSADGPGQRIPAYLDAELNDTAPVTWESIDSVVDEAMSRIGVPDTQRSYVENTACGRFGLLTRDGYPSVASDMKAILRWAFDMAEKHGSTK